MPLHFTGGDSGGDLVLKRYLRLQNVVSHFGYPP